MRHRRREMGAGQSTPPNLVELNTPGGKILVPPGTGLSFHSPHGKKYRQHQSPPPYGHGRGPVFFPMPNGPQRRPPFGGHRAGPSPFHRPGRGRADTDIDFLDDDEASEGAGSSAFSETVMGDRRPMGRRGGGGGRRRERDRGRPRSAPEMGMDMGGLPGLAGLGGMGGLGGGGRMGMKGMGGLGGLGGMGMGMGGGMKGMGGMGGMGFGDMGMGPGGPGGMGFGGMPPGGMGPGGMGMGPGGMGPGGMGGVGLTPDYTNNPAMPPGYQQHQPPPGMPGPGMPPYNSYPGNVPSSPTSTKAGFAAPTQQFPNRQHSRRHQPPPGHEYIPMGTYTADGNSRPTRPSRARTEPQTSTRLNRGQHSGGGRVGPSGKEWIEGDSFLDACICTTSCKCRKSQRVLYRTRNDRRNTPGNESDDEEDGPEYGSGEIRYILKDDLGRNCDDHSGCKQRSDDEEKREEKAKKGQKKREEKERKEQFAGFKEELLEALDERFQDMKREKDKLRNRMPKSPSSAPSTPRPAFGMPHRGASAPFNMGSSAPFTMGQSNPLNMGASAPFNMGQSNPMNMGPSAPFNMAPQGPTSNPFMMGSMGGLGGMGGSGSDPAIVDPRLAQQMGLSMGNDPYSVGGMPGMSRMPPGIPDLMSKPPGMQAPRMPIRPLGGAGMPFGGAGGDDTSVEDMDGMAALNNPYTFKGMMGKKPGRQNFMSPRRPKANGKFAVMGGGGFEKESDHGAAMFSRGGRVRGRGGMMGGRHPSGGGGGSGGGRRRPATEWESDDFDIAALRRGRAGRPGAGGDDEDGEDDALGGMMRDNDHEDEDDEIPTTRRVVTSPRREKPNLKWNGNRGKQARVDTEDDDAY